MRLSVDGLLRGLRGTDNPALLDSLFRRATPFVAGLARRMQVPESQVEDVVQDVFLAVLTGATRVPGRTPTLAWLMGITRNKVLARRRSAAQRRLPSGTLDEGVHPCPSVELELWEHSWLARDAIADLPARYRTILELRFFEALRAREIAKRLDLPASTVRTRLARGLERLRSAMNDAVARPSSASRDSRSFRRA